jgi:hypothetical protein
MFPLLSTVALAPGVLTDDAVAAATIAPGVSPLGAPLDPAGPISDAQEPAQVPADFGP